MVKDELIRKVVEDTGCSAYEAKRIINASIMAIQETLKGGEDVILRGLGTFEIKKRAPRSVRNINTGVQYTIASKRRVFFAPCKELKEI